MIKRKRKMNLLYIPALIFLLLFVIYPLGNAFYISLQKWNGYSQVKTFIGFKNYISMFQDKYFWTALGNTLLYGFGSTILEQIFGLALAVFVNSKFKTRNALRTIVYLPALISGLVMGYILYFFFQYDNGVINEIIGWFGFAPVDWMASGKMARIIIVIVNTWQFTGLSMIIYLAGLQGVSEEYYEAAKLDGGSSWSIFYNVTLPLIYPSIQSSIVFNLIGGLKLFDVIRSLTGGGPGNATHSLATYLTHEYFDAEKAGYAGALGVFMFFLIMVIAFVINSAFRKKGEDLM